MFPNVVELPSEESLENKVSKKVKAKTLALFLEELEKTWSDDGFTVFCKPSTKSKIKPLYAIKSLQEMANSEGFKKFGIKIVHTKISKELEMHIIFDEKNETSPYERLKQFYMAVSQPKPRKKADMIDYDKFFLKVNKSWDHEKERALLISIPEDMINRRYSIAKAIKKRIKISELKTYFKVTLSKRNRIITIHYENLSAEEAKAKWSNEIESVLQSKGRKRKAELDAPISSYEDIDWTVKELPEELLRSLSVPDYEPLLQDKESVISPQYSKEELEALLELPFEDDDTVSLLDRDNALVQDFLSAYGSDSQENIQLEEDKEKKRNDYADLIKANFKSYFFRKKELNKLNEAEKLLAGNSDVKESIKFSL